MRMDGGEGRGGHRSLRSQGCALSSRLKMEACPSRRPACQAQTTGKGIPGSTENAVEPLLHHHPPPNMEVEGPTTKHRGHKRAHPPSPSEGTRKRAMPAVCCHEPEIIQGLMDTGSSSRGGGFETPSSLFWLRGRRSCTPTRRGEVGCEGVQNKAGRHHRLNATGGGHAYTHINTHNRIGKWETESRALVVIGGKKEIRLLDWHTGLREREDVTEERKEGVFLLACIPA